MLDVGAYVGYYTILAARKVGPTGRVYAFDLTGAYAASVVLALLALAVIGTMTLLDRRKET